MSDIKYTITPEELLQRQGVKFRSNGRWLSFVYCIFCGGGNSHQQYTFGVHIRDGNFVCLRTTCDMKGSFWKLLEHYGYNPKEFIDHDATPKRAGTKKKGKMFVYGRRR